ncbi:endonuclease/exonuclease/phosphatase family protein [bacterium]|nr:MAG: endonuclease/exonuclease/phosphatase family protein [bacterium]
MLMQIMTFNLRYGSMKKPHSWPERRPVNKKLIEVASPDIIGTQEGFFWVLKEMAEDQPDYDWIGLGREGGSKSEFGAIFYRKSRLDPLEFDHFWLSDTPEVVGSSTWGNSNKRMVTWVKFKDKQQGNEFYVWNTHFDHETPLAREKSAELVVKRMAALKTNLPIWKKNGFSPAKWEEKHHPDFSVNQPFINYKRVG